MSNKSKSNLSNNIKPLPLPHVGSDRIVPEIISGEKITYKSPIPTLVSMSVAGMFLFGVDNTGKVWKANGSDDILMWKPLNSVFGV